MKNDSSEGVLIRPVLFRFDYFTVLGGRSCVLDRNLSENEIHQGSIYEAKKSRKVSPFTNLRCRFELVI